jgi:hypothetical protein
MRLDHSTRRAAAAINKESVMQRQIWSHRAAWFAMVALVLGSGAVANAQRVDNEAHSVRVILADEKDPKAVQLLAVLDATQGKADRYWIGVSCSQAGEPLRTQLGLTEGEGLVVDEVVEKSPAEKATLKKFDVLIKAGDKPLKSLEDLVAVVQNSKEAPIGLTLIRGGKRETIQVTPTKDPVQKQGVLALEVPAREALSNWLSDQTQWWEVTPDGTLSIRRPHPGIAFKYMALGSAALPKNVTITISKTGEDPAKITVKRDNQTWEVAENKIEELPEDIRKIVQSFLGHAQAAHIWRSPRVRAVPEAELNQRSAQDVAKALDELKLRNQARAEAPISPPQRRSVEERLESLDRKLERLQKSLEQLRDTKAQENR